MRQYVKMISHDTCRHKQRAAENLQCLRFDQKGLIALPGRRHFKLLNYNVCTFPPGQLLENRGIFQLRQLRDCSYLWNQALTSPCS